MGSRTRPPEAGLAVGTGVLQRRLPPSYALWTDDGKAGAGEMIALGLRTAEGVQLDAVSARFGIDARAVFGGTIEPLAAAGLIDAGERIRVTRRGWRVGDAIASEFVLLPEAEAIAEDAR